MHDATLAWRQLIAEVLKAGELVAPRHLKTLELAQHTIVVDSRRPVMLEPARRLSYRFMAAEAFWILSGDDRVATIAPYNERIADYSDDGETFFGAYGPRILEQLPYVVAKLKQDPSTRQAGLTTWRANPPKTKDAPCTVAFFFTIRQGELRCHVFMRSSDAWLGIPYDVFNFSMLMHLVCAHLNEGKGGDEPIVPGGLHLTAASSHLYEPQWAPARACLVQPLPRRQAATPSYLYMSREGLLTTLHDLREPSGKQLRWWEQRP